MKRPLPLALAATLALATTPAHADDFVVLHHRDNPVASFDADALRRLYTGRTKQWDRGAVVQVIVIPAEGAVETRYLAELLGMTPRELLSRMQQEVFRGEMRRPVIVRSSQECVAAVRSNPGGLCVATAASASSLPPDVQAARITH